MFLLTCWVLLDSRPSSPEGPSREEDVIVVSRLAEREEGHRHRVEVTVDERPVMGVDHHLEVRQLVLPLEQEVLDAVATRREEAIGRSPKSSGNHSVGDGLAIGLSCSVKIGSAEKKIRNSVQYYS